MVPRTEIKALEINKDVDEFRSLLIETGHSKIFIYEDTIDHIIGYIHVFDLFSNPKSIKEIIRKIDPHPETTTAKDLLKNFIENHKSAAIVLDEFGVKDGETTEDLTMSLETVGCIGCCGLAPVASINEDIVGEIKPVGREGFGLFGNPMTFFMFRGVGGGTHPDFAPTFPFAVFAVKGWNR